MKIKKKTPLISLKIMMKIIVYDRLSFILRLPWVHDVCRYVRTLVTDIANHITLGCPVV